LTIFYYRDLLEEAFNAYAVLDYGRILQMVVQVRLGGIAGIPAKTYQLPTAFPTAE
jgi:hypothetical protein